MKYSLSYCDITQLADNLFEAVGRPDIGFLDKNHADEAWKFWDHLRIKPFGLLVNSKHPFAHSFEGARDIGLHPLQKKTALLVYDEKQRKEFHHALQIKNATGDVTEHKIFTDREEAIEWLSDLAP